MTDIMRKLIPLTCPECRNQMVAVEPIGNVSTATHFADCLRRCEKCGIGVSNAVNPESVTYIYRNPLGNIPLECREGAIEALGESLNVRNRESKRKRFGFTTSEDAVTWVVFSYLYKSGKLVQALEKAKIFERLENDEVFPTVLLWGVPLNNDRRGNEIRQKYIEICRKIGEEQNSYSEPDVIIDLGKPGLVFIEVKYLSSNDIKPADYNGWSKYLEIPHIPWKPENVRTSGFYELARNWCLLNSLAENRPACLVNLGLNRIFSGEKGRQLESFIASLQVNHKSRFVKLTWNAFLEDQLTDGPGWITEYCRKRTLFS